MDKKQVILGTAVAMAVVLGYLALNAWLRSKHPEWFAQPQPQEVAHAPATHPATVPATGPSAVEGATTEPSTTTAPAAAPALASGLQLVDLPSLGQTAVIGSATPNDPDWAMRLTISPQGAGLIEALLNGYPHAADYRKPEKERRLYVFQEPYPDFPDTRPLHTRWIEVNGTLLYTHQAAWKREEVTKDSAKFSITVGRPGAAGADAQRVLKVYKTFRIFKRNPGPEVLTNPNTPQEAKGLGYEVAVDYRLENLGSDPLTVRSQFYGPTLPPRETTRPPDRQVMIGVNKDNADVEVEGHPVEAFTNKKPTFDLAKNEKGRQSLWFGTASVYFNAFVRPRNRDSIASATAVGLNVHYPTSELRPEDRPVTTSFETAAVTVPPAGSVSLPLSVYLGPRDRKILKTEYYASYPREYNDSLVLKVGPCARCTFDWLIDGLVLLLGAFQRYLFGGIFGHGDWGLAIIALVCVVRLALHPITKRSQVQMMKMGKLGPQVEKLKEKYGDDKEALNKEMVQLYKEQGFAPIFGCLPMFLQMPIWIALYSALQTTFELRQEPFLWGFTWIKDLSKPDYLIQFGHAVPLFFGWSFDGLNVLPILMGIVFWINQKYTPKPVAMNEQQEQQQKMMQWMTLLFPLFLYNGPSGLNLYILTSTCIGIAEAKVIRRHIKEREEAEKAGKVIIDAGRPTRAARRRKDGEPEPAKKTGFMGWLAELQDKVEQSRRDQDKRGKRKA